MNWTGGSLQRSKNANKGIVQKQKAHFARARTQLQNNAPASISPFHHSFFRGKEVSLGGRLPPFSSSRTVRHTGHSKTLQDHDNSIGSSPVRQGKPETHNLAQRRLLHAQEDTVAFADTNSRYHRDRGKRAAADDFEEDLLEARRKKLLQQSDWVGLVRPKPLATYFKAQDREMIGKRHALAVRKGHSRPVPRPLQTQTSRHPEQDTGGAHQNHDIKIRIGIDALTNVTPMQTSQSQAVITSYDASFESMLLSNEDLHIAPKPGQQVDQNRPKFVGVHNYCSRQPTQEPSLRSQQRYHEGGSVGAVRFDRPNDIRSSDHTFPADNVIPGEKDEATDCYSTHPIEGISRSLRLTFDAAPASLAALLMNKASPGNMIGVTSHGRETANATVVDSGNAVMEAGVGSAEARHSHSIDDSPWRAFLPAQTDRSSLSLADDPSTIDRAHDRPKLAPLRPSADFVPWSQQATQGDQTLMDSSTCVSPSLPSITRGDDRGQLQRRPRAGADELGCRSKKQRDEDDTFWQKLVFGSDKVESRDFVPGTKTGHMRGANRRIQPEDKSSSTAGHCIAYSGATHNLGEVKMIAEKGIPSSMAVALSSTPFDPVFGRCSCVSDSAQDATTRAPLATSSGSMLPMITSSTAPLSRLDQAKKSSKENSGDARLQQAEDSGFGLQSASHTSMQNNLSTGSNASPSRISGNSARASHADLDRREGCKADRFGPAGASGRKPASVYDIPMSSDEESGLDVVGYD